MEDILLVIHVLFAEIRIWLLAIKYN